MPRAESDVKLQFYPTDFVETLKMLPLIGRLLIREEYADDPLIQSLIRKRNYSVPSISSSQLIFNYLLENGRYEDTWKYLFLQIPEQENCSVMVADLFAGEGKWLELFNLFSRKKGDFVTVANELEDGRYQTCADNPHIDFAYHGPYEDLDFPKKLIDLMLFNPPYGTTNKISNAEYYLADMMKKEYFSVKNSIILMVLNKEDMLNCATTFCQYFNFKYCYKVAQEEFSKWGQYVVAGVLRTRPLTDRYSLSMLNTEILSFKKRINLASFSLPEASAALPLLYVAPKESKSILSVYQKSKKMPVKLSEVTSGLWERTKQMTSVTNIETSFLTTPRTPKPGELAQIIASGFINGEIGSGETSHIVVGGVKKVERTYLTQNSRGQEAVASTISNVPYLNILYVNPLGEIISKELLRSDSNVVEEKEDKKTKAESESASYDEPAKESATVPKKKRLTKEEREARNKKMAAEATQNGLVTRLLSKGFTQEIETYQKPYIITNGRNNTCRCSFDLLVTSPDDELLLVSLIDYTTVVRKAAADIRNYWYVDYGDYEEPLFKNSFKPSSYHRGQNVLFATTEKNNGYCHTIMRNEHLLKDYIINWNDEDISPSLTSWLRKTHQLPVTEDMVSYLLSHCKEPVLIPCKVISNHDTLKNLKVYKPDIELIQDLVMSPEFYNDTQFVSQRNTVDWNSINSIDDYVFHFLDTIVDILKSKIKTLYSPKRIESAMFEGRFQPLIGQVAPIQAAIEVLSQSKEKFAFLASEQGTGKTSMSINVLNGYLRRINKKNPTIFVLVPTTTLPQWVEEINDHFYTNDINIYTISKTSDFIHLYDKCKLKFNKPTFILCGKETFKLQYTHSPAVLDQHKVPLNNRLEQLLNGEIADESSLLYENIYCPECFNPVKNTSSVGNSHLAVEDIVTYKDKSWKYTHSKLNHKCPDCNSTLWSASYNKTKKTSVIDFIRKKRIKVDITILDECQDSNNSESIIGNSTNVLLRNHSKRSILLSGTPNNGYASSLYNLLMALIPRTLFENKVYSERDFIAQYGTLECVKSKEDDLQQYMATGKIDIKDSDYREVEGINPIAFVKFLAKNYIFMQLKDLGKDLPPLNEYYIPIEPLSEQKSVNDALFRRMSRVSRLSAAFMKDSIVKHHLNNPFNWNPIKMKSNDGIVNVYTETLDDENLLLPKEEKLLDIVRQEISEKRKTWIYVDFNYGGEYMYGTPIPSRLKKLLEKEGISTYILPSGDPAKRKALIDKNKHKYEVFISNRKLVAVGLNLQAFSSFINYMPSFKINDVEQANRRGWRANSTLENRIYNLYYDVDVESKVMKRYDRKKAESNAIQCKFDVTLQDENVRTQSSFGKAISNKLTFFTEELPDVSMYLKKEEIQSFKESKAEVVKVAITYNVFESTEVVKSKKKATIYDGQLTLAI